MSATPQLSLSTVIRRNPEQVFTDMDGEIVMMDIHQGNYYGLNSVASDIWQQLESPMPLEALLIMICERYDVTREQAQTDTFAFVEQLFERKLVQSVN